MDGPPVMHHQVLASGEAIAIPCVTREACKRFDPEPGYSAGTRSGDIVHIVTGAIPSFLAARTLLKLHLHCCYRWGVGDGWACLFGCTCQSQLAAPRPSSRQRHRALRGLRRFDWQEDQAKIRKKEISMLTSKVVINVHTDELGRKLIRRASQHEEHQRIQ